MPTDDSARQAISERLDSNLYIEAGAGTGKTTSLVSRIVTIITTGRAAIDQVVAITFTRAAASELRSRIREQLEAVNEGDHGAEAKSRVLAALERIDDAAFQTIDSFALSLLRERPLEIGVPPVITPRDELEAEIEFSEEWRRWLDTELSAEDGQFREAVGRAMRLGLSSPLSVLRDVALKFHQNYDVVNGEEFIPPTSTQSHSFDAMAAELSRIENLMGYCTDSSDRLYLHVESTVRPWVGRFENATPGSVNVDYLLAECPRLSAGKTTGRQGNWPSAGSTIDPKQQVLDSLSAMQELMEQERRAAAGSALSDLLQCVQRMVLNYAVRRREAGALEFHDMLILARDLLASAATVRDYFHAKYPVVLVDEFQDTDPVQSDLLELLTQDEDGPAAGSLFRVGDPKQSIYRFRRADVSVSDDVRESAEARRDWLPLRENHRSQAPIIGWVNHVFADWMGSQRRLHGRLQADYIPLIPSVGAGTGSAPGRSATSLVRWFGGSRPEPAHVVRRREFEQVAHIAVEAGNGAFAVRDAGSNEVRQSTYGDVCVLLRTRTGIDLLEQAFADASVPFSLEGQSLVFGTQEFRDLENALCAVDDPTDQVAVVAALRSPVFGCSDEEIWSWADKRGRFDYSVVASAETAAESPRVAAAFDVLGERHRERMAYSFPAIVERLVRGQKLLESAHLGPQETERVRRIELFVDHARQLRDAGVTSLRGFLSWLAERREGRARAPETVTSESGLDAVRVMTIHGAKGLEFPIIIVTGSSSTRTRSPDAVLFDSRAAKGDRVNVRLGRRELMFETPGYSHAADQDGSADEAETARLMYVAATRARDHLFVSLFRSEAKTDHSPAARFESICAGRPGIWAEYAPAADAVAAFEHAQPLEIDLSVEARKQWIEAREAVLRSAVKRSYVTATELKPSANVQLLPKESSPDGLDEPWRRGRGALALGRAVHGVLQYAALDGSNVDQLAEEQAAAHDLEASDAATVADLARKTLESPSVAAAAGRSNCWRELWIAAALGPRSSSGREQTPTLEGTIDLIYEADDGSMVIVDYKTDRVEGAILEEKARPYVSQLGAYAWAVTQLTGRRVSKAVLVFSSEAAQARQAEYEISDLATAMDSAVELARAAVGQPPV